MAKTGGGRGKAERRGHGSAAGSPAAGTSAAFADETEPGSGSGPRRPAPAPVKIRLDKWLWQARFFKTRSLAAAIIGEGHIRVNSIPVSRPAREVGPGDVLTFPQGRNIRLIRITGTGSRRGPASEAQTLFIDLDAPAAAPDALD